MYSIHGLYCGNSIMEEIGLNESIYLTEIYLSNVQI